MAEEDEEVAVMEEERKEETDDEVKADQVRRNNFGGVTCLPCRLSKVLFLKRDPLSSFLPSFLFCVQKKMRSRSAAIRSRRVRGACGGA